MRHVSVAQVLQNKQMRKATGNNAKNTTVSILIHLLNWCTFILINNCDFKLGTQLSHLGTNPSFLPYKIMQIWNHKSQK